MFVTTHLLWFLEYEMIDGNSLDLIFEFGLYGGMLDKKAKKGNEQFSIGFVKEMKESSKSGKQSSLTNE